MADCDNTDYQMIDPAALTDIDNAQVITAEIDDIDTDANTADITLLGSSCAALSEVSLDDVEFFYHCEDSTGTLEDLARGSNAFLPGDVVYVLYIPANGDVTEKFYIIGHVDIKGTNTCEIAEYLLFKTTNSYTIFDTAAGATLDMDSFENIDASSPTKPTRLPFRDGDTDYLTAWLAYNFSASAAGASLGGSLSQISLHTTSYTTDTFRNDTSSTGADPGYHDFENKTYSSLDSENIVHLLTYQDGSGYTGSISYGREYTSMDTDVDTYYCTGESEGIEFYDTADASYRNIFINKIEDIQTSGQYSATLSGSYYYPAYTASVYSSQKVEATTDYDSTNETLWSVSGSFSCGSGFIDGPGNPQRTFVNDTILTLDIAGGSYQTYKLNGVGNLAYPVATRRHIAIIGFYGFYFLYYYSCGAMEFDSSNVSTYTLSFYSSNNGNLLSGMGEHNFLYYYTPNLDEDGVTGIAVNVIYPLVSMFSGIDISSGTAGMFDLLDNRNSAKSAGLQSCIDDLLKAEFEFCELPDYTSLSTGITDYDAYRKKSDIA